MLTEIYIDALLVDEELADQVWEVWDADETDDQVAWLAWWLIANDPKRNSQLLRHLFYGMSLVYAYGAKQQIAATGEK